MCSVANLRSNCEFKCRNVKYGLALAEQSTWNAGQYTNSDYSLCAASKDGRHGKVVGLLSKGSVPNQTVGDVEFWVSDVPYSLVLV